MSLLHSLRARLFVAIGLIVALSVAVTLVLGVVLTRRAVQEATLKDLAHQAALIVGEERNALSPLTHLPQLRPLPGAAARALPARHLRAVLRRAAKARARPPGHRRRDVDGADYYYAAEPVGKRAFILLRPKSSTNPRWTPSSRRSSSPLSSAGCWPPPPPSSSPGGSSRPVARVAAARRSLAAGRRPEPVPVEGAAELATLAVAFNDLAEQLARAREAERSFLLSVSHELKTPLTAIRGTPRRSGRRGRRRMTRRDDRRVEAERLERLVGDLLDLARMNRTDFSVRPSEIDLGEVAEDVVRRYEQQAERSASRSRRSPTGRRPLSPTPTAYSRSSRTSSRTRCG